jgi:hypothetical protein
MQLAKNTKKSVAANMFAARISKIQLHWSLSLSHRLNHAELSPKRDQFSKHLGHMGMSENEIYPQL